MRAQYPHPEGLWREGGRKLSMVYIVVPYRAYNRVIREIPTPMWAWVDVRVGRTYAIEADPWEGASRLAQARLLLVQLKARPAHRPA